MEGRRKKKEGKAREVDGERGLWTVREPLPSVSHAEQVTFLVGLSSFTCGKGNMRRMVPLAPGGQ